MVNALDTRARWVVSKVSSESFVVNWLDVGRSDIVQTKLTNSCCITTDVQKVVFNLIHREELKDFHLVKKRGKLLKYSSNQLRKGCTLSQFCKGTQADKKVEVVADEGRVCCHCVEHLSSSLRMSKVRNLVFEVSYFLNVFHKCGKIVFSKLRKAVLPVFLVIKRV